MQTEGETLLEWIFSAFTKNNDKCLRFGELVYFVLGDVHWGYDISCSQLQSLEPPHLEFLFQLEINLDVNLVLSSLLWSKKAEDFINPLTQICSVICSNSLNV